MDRKRRNRRGWVMVLVCVVCFPASVAALYGVLVLPLPKWRAGAIALFAGGFVLSVVGGWVLGRLLWYAARKGGVILGILALDALATVVFVFALLSMPQGHPISRHILCEPIIFTATIQLLVANSYAVGFAFFPGPASISGGRRLLVLLFLYGAIAAGVVIQRAFPLPWEKVPPFPAKEPRRMTFEEFMADLRKEFPKEYRIEETPEGVIRIIYERPRLRWWPTELHDDTFMAEGNRAVLPDGTVEILGLDMYCREQDFILPDGTPQHIEPEEQDPHRGRPADDERLPWIERVGFWRLDGTPVPEEEWPREEKAWSREILLYGGALIEAKGDIRPYSLGGDQMPIVFLPWRTQVAETTSGLIPVFDEERNVWWRVLDFNFGPPIPGPLELRLAYLRSDEREYIFDGKEGDVIHLERESLQLLKIAEGRYERESGQKDWDLSLALVEKTEDVPTTTVVFAALVHKYEPEPLRLDIRAVTRDGSALGAAKINYFNHFIFVQFQCRPEEIDRIIFIERPHVTQIRFPVTDIPFFPRENFGLDNMIDMRFPYRVRYPKDIRRSLPDGRLGSGMPQFIVNTPMKNPLNASLREILDHYYPGAWWVEDGKLAFSRGSPGLSRCRIAGKIRSALEL